MCAHFDRPLLAVPADDLPIDPALDFLRRHRRSVKHALHAEYPARQVLNRVVDAYLETLLLALALRYAICFRDLRYWGLAVGERDGIRGGVGIRLTCFQRPGLIQQIDR